MTDQELYQKAYEIAQKFYIVEMRVLGNSKWARNVRDLFRTDKWHYEEVPEGQFPHCFVNEDETKALYFQYTTDAKQAQELAEQGHAVIQVIDGFGEEASMYHLIGTIIHNINSDDVVDEITSLL